MDDNELTFRHKNIDDINIDEVRDLNDEYITKDEVEESKDSLLKFIYDEEIGLTEREYAIFKKRFFGGFSFEKIANQFAIPIEKAMHIYCYVFHHFVGTFQVFIDLEYPDLKKAVEDVQTQRREIERLDSRFESFCSFVRERAPHVINSFDFCNNEPKEYLIKIEDLDLSVRSYNCLRRAGLLTTGDISRLTVEQLLKIRNLGKRSLYEIVDRLRQRGICILHDYEVTRKEDPII